MKDLSIQEGSFVCLPLKWVMELSGEDLKKMAILHWRFSFFAHLAQEQGEDVRKCFYESQQRLASLFGMSENSRTKVGVFLRKMEAAGYVSIIREKVLVAGETKPRHYITVNDPTLLERYKIT